MIELDDVIKWIPSDCDVTIEKIFRQACLKSEECCSHEHYIEKKALERNKRGKVGEEDKKIRFLKNPFLSEWLK